MNALVNPHMIHPCVPVITAADGHANYAPYRFPDLAPDNAPDWGPHDPPDKIPLQTPHHVAHFPAHASDYHAHQGKNRLPVWLGQSCVGTAAAEPPALKAAEKSQ
jgi:hypothetical protein